MFVLNSILSSIKFKRSLYIKYSFWHTRMPLQLRFDLFTNSLIPTHQISPVKTNKGYLAAWNSLFYLPPWPGNLIPELCADYNNQTFDHPPPLFRPLWATDACWKIDRIQIQSTMKLNRYQRQPAPPALSSPSSTQTTSNKQKRSSRKVHRR